MINLVISPDRNTGAYITGNEFRRLQYIMNELGTYLECNIQLSGFFVDCREDEIKEEKKEIKASNI